MAQKEISEKYDKEVIWVNLNWDKLKIYAIHLFNEIEMCSLFYTRKQKQRASLLWQQTILSPWTTLLEIWVWDGSFATFLKQHARYIIIWYDIQNLLSDQSSLEAYYVWWDNTLETIFDNHTIDAILIAYTLHHMSDAQINNLLTILESHHLPVCILEETYIRNKCLVVLSDILSNIMQYGLFSINRKEYFKLNFKTTQKRQELFEKKWFKVKRSQKKIRYGYLHTVWFIITK